MDGHEELKSLREAFATWRTAKRNRRDRVPEVLRSRVSRLAGSGEVSKSKIFKTLGLDATALDRWSAQGARDRAVSGGRLELRAGERVVTLDGEFTSAEVGAIASVLLTNGEGN